MASDSDIPAPGISIIKGPGSSMYARIISDDPAIVDFVTNFGCASITKRYLDDIVNVTIKNSIYFSAAVSQSPSTSISAPPASSSEGRDVPPVDDDSLELLAFDRLAAGSAAGSANGDCERRGCGGIDPESLLVFKCVCGKQCSSSSGLSRHRKLCDSFKSQLALAEPETTVDAAETPEPCPDDAAVSELTSGA